MEKDHCIVVTGAAGFIGSCLVAYLNKLGYENLLLVDDFSRKDKESNLLTAKYSRKIERDTFLAELQKSRLTIAFVFHIGARTDTTEFDYSVHEKLNVEYSKSIWNYCATEQIPLIYASSAATYGSGEMGYEDNHSLPDSLKPLNPYGISKNEFDKWVLTQHSQPPFWAGLKFFNVFGPNEYHKGRMASVIFHAYGQIVRNGSVKLFRSHKPGFDDGKQLRDFVYVKDVLSVCHWLMKYQPASGLYNLGTGKARSFLDLVHATFAAMHLNPSIVFIDMPEDIRETYQYFTEANMDKLRSAGYQQDFYSLEDAVADYVQNYLSRSAMY